METKENEKRKVGANKRAALGRRRREGQWEGWKSDQQGANREKDSPGGLQ